MESSASNEGYGISVLPVVLASAVTIGSTAESETAASTATAGDDVSADGTRCCCGCCCSMAMVSTEDQPKVKPRLNQR